MNLLERCQTANAKIAALVEAKKAKEVADNIRKRVSDLSDASESLLDYSGRATVLLDAGILKTTELIDDSKLAHQLTEMRQKLTQDPSSITSGNPSPVNKWKRAMVKYAVAITKIADATWDEYVNEITPKVDSKLLKQYRDTSYADLVAELEANSKIAKKQSKLPPVDAAALNELKNTWNEIRSGLADLPVTEDPEVRAFLLAVGSEDGAAIELLSPVVIEWLRENGMSDQFCIRNKR